MPKKKTIEELQAEQEKLENELKVKTEKLKALKAQTKEQMRKERTHRLCTHGGMLEQYLPPEEYTDDQLGAILKSLFQDTQVKQMLQRVKQTERTESQ